MKNRHGIWAWVFGVAWAALIELQMNLISSHSLASWIVTGLSLICAVLSFRHADDYFATRTERRIEARLMKVIRERTGPQSFHTYGMALDIETASKWTAREET